MITQLVGNSCDPTLCGLLTTARNNAVGIVTILLTLLAFIYMARDLIFWYQETNRDFKAQHLHSAFMKLAMGSLIAVGGLLIIFNGAGANIMSFFGIK